MGGGDAPYDCYKRVSAQNIPNRMVPVRGKVSADLKTIIFQYRDLGRMQDCTFGYRDFEVIYTR